MNEYPAWAALAAVALGAAAAAVVCLLIAWRERTGPNERDRGD
ncbi:MAG: hypothetical protein AB7V08_14025 [Elusimicrobiales bacterium]